MPKESQEPAKARKNAEPTPKPRKPATRTARVAKKSKVTHDMIARRDMRNLQPDPFDHPRTFVADDHRQR